MSQKYKHLIWDWNGTLFNDVNLCNDIINNLLEKNGIAPLSLQKYREIFTFPIKDYYTKAGFDFSKTSFEVLGKEFMDEYEQRKTEAAIFNNVKDILEYVKSKGLTQSILSAYVQNVLEEFVKYFRIRDYFIGLAGLDNIYAESKIEIGKKWIKNLNYREKDILLIGDTKHDFEVAQELGVNCILVTTGHQSQKRLEECGVSVFNDLEAIKEYLIPNNGFN
jgi:phosphoglycolate phosphatase